jgi:hypothetical protein
MSPRSETAVLYPRHECHNDGEACGRRWYSTRADHLEPKCRIGQPRAARACMSTRQAWPRLRYRIRWLLAGEHWFHRIKHDELRTAAIGLNLRGQLPYLFCNSVQTSGRRHSAEQDTAVSILVLVKFPRTKKGSVRRAGTVSGFTSADDEPDGSALPGWRRWRLARLLWSRKL